MSEKRLIFPCGAYFPLNEWPVDGAHYAKDGAIRLSVHPGTKPTATDETLERLSKKYKFSVEYPYDGTGAPCQFYCPTPKRRREEHGYDANGKLGKYISCYARLNGQEHIAEGDEAWYDITPMPPPKCPHCEEQRTFIAACKRAARMRTEAPDRAAWRLCPQCGNGAEVMPDTGLCPPCQLARVVCVANSAAVEERR